MNNVYHTEDGLAFSQTDQVYNYYDMEVITVGEDAGQGWFYYTSQNGGGVLNGERTCSMRLAQARGWVSMRRFN